jgi:hypothetical protein
LEIAATSLTASRSCAPCHLGMTLDVAVVVMAVPQVVAGATVAVAWVVMAVVAG